MPVTVQRLFLYNPYSEDEPWCAELSSDAAIGVDWGGIAGLVRLLENHGGFGGEEISRAELFVKAVDAIGKAISAEHPVYRSFTADRYGTAETLLSWRRELLYGGWNGDCTQLPERIRMGVELLSEADYGDVPDRIRRAIAVIDKGAPVVIDSIQCLFPERRALVRRLFDILRVKHAVKVDAYPDPESRAGATALAAIRERYCSLKSQSAAVSGTDPVTPPVDDSIRIITAYNITEAAESAAAILRKLPSEETVLISGSDSCSPLMHTLNMRGIPVPGMTVPDGADPLLQFVPLYLNAVTEQYNTNRFLEYLLLPESPVPGIRYRLAREFARNPGRGSESWSQIIAGKSGDAPAENESTDAKNIIAERLKLFVPGPEDLMPADAIDRETVIEALKTFRDWLNRKANADTDSGAALRMQRSMAASAVGQYLDLLAVISAGTMTMGELLDQWERVIEGVSRKIDREAGSVFRMESPLSFIKAADMVVWWDCRAEDIISPSAFLTASERASLVRAGIEPVSADHIIEDCELSWRRILCGAGKLVIVSIDEGKEYRPHPILNIMAGLVDKESYSSMRYSPRETMDPDYRREIKPADETSPITAHRMEIDVRDTLKQNISVSDIESLIRCPFAFILKKRYGLGRIRDVRIQEATAAGNAIHSYLENCVTAKRNLNDDTAVLADIIMRKAAFLNEAERTEELHDFMRFARGAADSLFAFIGENRIEDFAAEQEMPPLSFNDSALAGRADFIGTMNGERVILDYKYGKSNYIEKFKKKESFQVAAYLHAFGAGYAGYLDVKKSLIGLYGKQTDVALAFVAEEGYAEVLTAYLDAAASCMQDLAGHVWKSPWDVKKTKVSITEEKTEVALKPYCASCGFSLLCSRPFTKDDTDGNGGDE